MNQSKNILRKPISDKYYHESGHVILNRLFDEILLMELVTVDETLSQDHDKQSYGGVKGKYAIPVVERSIFDNDKAILIFLGGLCIDTLVENSRIIDESFFNPEIWKDKLENEHKYSGDRDLIGTTFQYIRNDISLSFNEYIISCFKVIFKILNDEIIWNAIISIRKALIQKLTLNAEEIDQILFNEGFEQWKIENKTAITTERLSILS